MWNGTKHLATVKGMFGHSNYKIPNNERGFDRSREKKRWKRKFKEKGRGEVKYALAL